MTTLASHQWNAGPFRSNAERLVAKVPVIEVEGMTAKCNGGGGALGHPVEYIQLNTVTPGEVGERARASAGASRRSRHGCLSRPPPPR